MKVSIIQRLRKIDSEILKLQVEKSSIEAEIAFKNRQLSRQARMRNRPNPFGIPTGTLTPEEARYLEKIPNQGWINMRNLFPLSVSKTYHHMKVMINILEKKGFLNRDKGNNIAKVRTH